MNSTPRSPCSSAEAHSSASPSCFRASMIILVAFIVLADARFIRGDNATTPSDAPLPRNATVTTHGRRLGGGRCKWSNWQKKMVCPVAKPAGAAQPEQQLDQKTPSSAQQNGRSAGNGAALPLLGLDFTLLKNGSSNVFCGFCKAQHAGQ